MPITKMPLEQLSNSKHSFLTPHRDSKQY